MSQDMPADMSYVCDTVAVRGYAMRGTLYTKTEILVKCYNIFRRICKMQKAAINFAKSVSLSVHPSARNKSAPNGRIFREFLNLRLFKLIN